MISSAMLAAEDPLRAQSYRNQVCDLFLFFSLFLSLSVAPLKDPSRRDIRKATVNIPVNISV